MNRPSIWMSVLSTRWPLVSLLLVLLATNFNCGTNEDPEVTASDEADSRLPSSGGVRFTVALHFRSRLGIGLESVRFGEIHSHTSLSLDAVGFAAVDGVKIKAPDEAIVYARDVQKLDFVGLSDHAEATNTLAMPAAHRLKGYTPWRSVLETIGAYNDENFSDGKGIIVFAGWEYTNTHGCADGNQGTLACSMLGGSTVGYGHKNVLFKSIAPQDLPQDRYGAGGKTAAGFVKATAYDLFSALAPYRPASGCSSCEGTALTGIHTPAMGGEGGAHDHRTDWNAMDAAFTCNVEIYSKWGSAEGPPPSGQSCADDQPFDYDPSRNDQALTLRTVLYEKWVKGGNAAYLLSFLGGTDNHWGMPAVFDHPSAGGEMPYRGGVTGIVAPQKTRNDLWTGLVKRHTIAATTSPSGTRMPVLLSVETGGRVLLMGDQGPHDGKAQVRVLAPSGSSRIELLVDGCRTTTVNQDAASTLISLSQGRHFVYARVSKVVGGVYHQAWTSPVYLGQ